MSTEWGVLFHLDAVRFDAYGRALVADRKAARRMLGLLAEADAIACRSGCGAPLSCDTALILREELTSVGPDLLVNNADFATIIRKRKAVGAEEAVIVFSTYCRVGIEQIAAERA
ncbi:MAG: hypothetical protein ACJAU5_001659 [Maricaulis maris]|jgi:hypothetical protein|uniref:Uncharacterized protein n=1 Tax=Maricaulis maris (strain MCS10) TaxID=394221 RepID=Q0AMP1_MARMM|nr:MULTISPECIES: hypothetical protein [Maricaulis]ABI66446.1 hypothetical protein Mmar10_2154 [Maricaulis maris MCS10]MAC89762.1 hypothetical protein [Maricaulis sp.]